MLRTDTSGNPSFGELIGRVRATNLAAYSHQDVPFERLVEVLNPARSLSHHPLFQVMLALHNHPDASFDLPGLTVTFEPVDTASAKFDLSLRLSEQRFCSHVGSNCVQHDSNGLCKLIEELHVHKLKGEQPGRSPLAPSSSGNGYSAASAGGGAGGTTDT